MKRFLAAIALGWVHSLVAAGSSFSLPKFPLPALVQDDFGQAKRIGFLSFLRQLQAVLDQVAADIGSRTSAQTRTLAVDLARPDAASVIAALSAVIPADLLQKIILVAIFSASCAGACG